MIEIISLNEHGQRINNPDPSRSELLDAQIELDYIVKDIDRLIERLTKASKAHGCIWEQCHNAAEWLAGIKHDDIDVMQRWIEDRICYGC